MKNKSFLRLQIGTRSLRLIIMKIHVCEQGEEDERLGEWLFGAE